MSVFTWKKASGETSKRSRAPSASSSSAILSGPRSLTVSPSRVVSATPPVRVQRKLSAPACSASSAARKSPALVTTRAWTIPVLRPSRTTRFLRNPEPSRRSQDESPSARHQAFTRSRSSSTRGDASTSSVTSSISFQRPARWKPSSSSPPSPAPNEYSSLLR